MTDKQETVAVVGGGIAGILSAYILSKKYAVTLFERNAYVGGHTNTVVVDDEGKELPVDTGFIVLNDRTYPVLHKFLDEIGVSVRFADMSFGFHCERTGLQYSGRGFSGLFAEKKNLFSPSFLKMLFELKSFNAMAAKELHEDLIPEETFADYLERKQISAFLRENYLYPMGAAIWSSPDQGIADFPAKTFLRFFWNHGLLTLSDRPKWQTVVGGSFAYVKRFLEIFPGDVFRENPVKTVLRKEGKAELVFGDGETKTFDRVVIATHADEALKLLGDPRNEEKELLSPWSYQLNRTVLHTDRSVLPPKKGAWASWNYVRERAASGVDPVSVTYHMNRLQGFSSRKEYCVTLNRRSPIKESEIIREIDYMHPVFSFEAVKTQEKLRQLNGMSETYFAGSYFGFGFHEDAAKSAVAVAESLGVAF